MRIIGNIPHPDIRITIFSMNEKYVIKLEAGPMEQVYKVAQNEVEGMEGIKNMVDEAFLSKAMERFNDMFLSLKSALEKN